MIFVTVGTHEQPFERLIKCVDDLKREKLITEKIVIQTGYTNYIPQYCEWQKFYSYNEMQNFAKQAHIFITHGGPSSFIMPLQYGKIPIVVPRQKQYNEHINNHQVDFAQVVQERQKNILVVQDISTLGSVIERYDEIVSKMSKALISNNSFFNDELQIIIDRMYSK